MRTWFSSNAKGALMMKKFIIFFVCLTLTAAALSATTPMVPYSEALPILQKLASNLFGSSVDVSLLNVLGRTLLMEVTGLPQVPELPPGRGLLGLPAPDEFEGPICAMPKVQECRGDVVANLIIELTEKDLRLYKPCLDMIEILIRNQQYYRYDDRGWHRDSSTSSRMYHFLWDIRDYFNETFKFDSFEPVRHYFCHLFDEKFSDFMSALADTTSDLSWTPHMSSATPYLKCNGWNCSLLLELRADSLTLQEMGQF
jgi:hypothetical protein